MEKEETRDLLMSDDFSTVENSPLWREEEFVPITLNREQYESLKRGFQPDWEFRYKPHFINGWHYLSRSGYWVKKFRFEYDEEFDEYTLVECYSTDKEYGHPLLAQSLHYGYYNPRIWTDEEARKYWFEYQATMVPAITVNRKPIKCEVCGQTTVLNILYGKPTNEALEAAERNEIILGGCCISDDSPDWQCSKCGQRYKKA